MRASIGLLFALTATSACQLPPMISNTGYRGTWVLRSASRQSIMAITESEGRWYFRWTKRSFDGKETVLCDWEGRCEERINGNVAATFTITTRYDAGSNTLSIETAEDRMFPVKRSHHYGEVMEVADAGRTLRNYTTDLDGQHFEGGARPYRSFLKIADSVADPPRPKRP